MTAFIPILIFLIILSILAVWAHKQSKKKIFTKPMNWYYYYTYIRLPLAIIATIIGLYGIFVDGHNTSVAILYLTELALLVLLFKGLSEFKAWGWQLNIAALILECLGLATLGTGVGVLVGFIWFSTNFTYFYKRKELFGIL